VLVKTMCMCVSLGSCKGLILAVCMCNGTWECQLATDSEASCPAPTLGHSPDSVSCMQSKNRKVVV